MPDFNLEFFNKAMKSLNVGSTSHDFATNYANASGAAKGTSIWQSAYEEGLRQFSTIDLHSGSEGVLDDDEFKIVGLYVERMNGKDRKLPQTIEEFSGNSQLNNLGYMREEDPMPKSNPDITEQHNLKPVGTMTKEELEAELERYRNMGILEQKQDSVPEESDLEPKKQSPEKSKGMAESSQEQDLRVLRKLVSEARAKLNQIDRNSDVVDFHIGTFNQGDLGDCSLLSQLNGLSDEQMRRMVQEKKDENGNTYYEITFPIDSNTGTSVIVTAEELNSRSIRIEDVIDGEQQSRAISNFSRGDADVTLMEMAFIKRFGIDPVVNGIDIKFINDIFTYPEEGRQHVGTTYNITEDKLISAMQSGEHATIALTHASRLPQDFSYDAVFQSSSGITARMGLFGNRKDLLLRLESMFKKYGNDTPDMSIYQNMSDTELMDAVNRFVSEDFGFTGELRLSNGVTIMEDHALTLKNYNPETKELTIANPHNSNEDIIVPLDVAQRYLEVSI